MPLPRNIVLIGYRGCGKSSVAPLLAERLGWRWADSDDLIEEKAGATIAEIFARQGESRFRELEADQVAQLASLSNIVASLGGGAVLSPANREALANSHVIWLHAPATVIAQRLAADPTTRERRPALTSTGALDEIHDVLTRREPLYRQCADWEFSTADLTPQTVADKLHLMLIGDLE